MGESRYVLLIAVALVAGLMAPMPAAAEPLQGEPPVATQAAAPLLGANSESLDIEAEASVATQPNFVVIVTDDQKWDSVGRCAPELDPFDFDAGTEACMPNLQDMLMDAGTTYLKGQVTQSLCCPSRASILTGQYSTTHGVTNNNGGLFDDTSTVATWLDDVGYRTALFGKYLNGYGLGGLAEYLPPGWDVFEGYHGYRNTDDPYTDYPWISFAEGDPVGVVSRINDVDSTSGDACADGNLYSTDYICNLSVDFLQADATTPFFAYINPATPHSPYTVADRHVGEFSGINIPHYPSTNVLPSPNPPSYLPVQDLRDNTLDRIEGTLRNVLALTLPVDDMIGVLHAELEADGRLDNTVWIFISDNGISSSEHHWRNKGCEYYTCHQVPFIVVCPTGVCAGSQAGVVDASSYVLNVDIAPTLAELAGATPTIPVDGISMVPLLNNPQAAWRTEWFIHGNNPFYEGIVAIGTDGDWYKYVEFPSVAEFELYNLDVDPWELSNLAGNGAYAVVEADLAARLDTHLNGGSPPNVAPTAVFSAACTDLECDFTDASSDPDGTVTSWDWDFGDGGVSTSQSPAHTYGVAGTYTVTLTVTDNDGATDSTSSTATVTDPTPNVGPTAGFTASCTDLSCDFTDTSTDADGTVVSWDWDFGDGGTATDQNPSHLYTGAGTFTVTLTVTDNDGATDVVSSDVTVAANVAPTAGFTSVCTDLTCDFTDTSTDSDGTVASWEWDFGDGGTSTDRNPTHAYAADGTYTVSLTVTDDDGATDVTSSDVTVADSGTGPFQEADGQVVMEAEHYTAVVDRSGDAWTSQAEPEGFSGDAAMAALPDDGTRLRVDLANTAPEMSFDVDFITTGTYYVWLRAWAPDIRGKAMFVGLDGVQANDGISAGGAGAWQDGVLEWTWSNSGRTGAQVVIEVTDPGVHTLQVWMGDDGVIVDKIIMTTDSGFVPTDEGPPESPFNAAVGVLASMLEAALAAFGSL